jgi:hypothetical protein
VRNFDVPTWEYTPWYGSTPTQAPENYTGNLTAATPSLAAGPTTVPTPLATDANRTRPGMSIEIIVAMLAGLVCIGYITYLGYMMIRR